MNIRLSRKYNLFKKDNLINEYFIIIYLFKESDNKGDALTHEQQQTEEEKGDNSESN